MTLTEIPKVDTEVALEDKTFLIQEHKPSPVSLIQGSIYKGRTVLSKVYALESVVLLKILEGKYRGNYLCSLSYLMDTFSTPNEINITLPVLELKRLISCLQQFNNESLYEEVDCSFMYSYLIDIKNIRNLRHKLATYLK